MSGSQGMSGPNDTHNTASSPDLATPLPTALEGAPCVRIEPLDRAMVLYLTLPLALFLAGWFRPAAAVALLLALAWALWPVVRSTTAGAAVSGGAVSGGAVPAGAAVPAGSAGTRPRALTREEMALAIGVALVWTLCGGTGHWLFANPDWPVRDAVLHDLVAGRWPVGYGALDGAATILRAPLGFYLPAALVGKLAGLRCAHLAMLLWTALGATLFLLAAVSLMPGRRASVLVAVAVVVLFSGLDIVGGLIYVPGFLSHWQPTRHLEWWAGRYQYSSMTTQLFWVPNHALGAWLGIALLARERAAAPRAAAPHSAVPRAAAAPPVSERERSALDPLWPLLIVALALWSPLAALGLVPFVLWDLASRATGVRFKRMLRPRSWLPALVIGLALASYLVLDAARIPKGWTFGRHGLDAPALTQDFVRQGTFFLLEAGLIGGAVLALVRSSELVLELVLALVILALLPLVSFGAANDLVMRASIPSLTVLALGAALALVRAPPTAGELGTARSGGELGAPARRVRKAALALLLLIGAVTPLQEFARALVLPRWPIDLEARLIEASCGAYPVHYIARLKSQLAAHLLRAPQALSGASETRDCRNPARRLMRERGLL